MLTITLKSRDISAVTTEHAHQSRELHTNLDVRVLHVVNLWFILTRLGKPYGEAANNELCRYPPVSGDPFESIYPYA